MNTTYQPGQTVFLVRVPKSLCDKPDTTAKVEYSFIGEDKEEYVVVKFKAPDGTLEYRLVKYNSLWDTLDGQSNFQKRMLDPKYSREFGIRAGIYNEDGTLTTSYGGEYDLINGTKFYADDDIQ